MPYRPPMRPLLGFDRLDVRLWMRDTPLIPLTKGFAGGVAFCAAVWAVCWLILAAT